jgi:hypothetical protein
VTAYDIASVVNSIKIADPTQTQTASKITVLTIRNTGLFDINVGVTPSMRCNRGKVSLSPVPSWR